MLGVSPGIRRRRQPGVGRTKANFNPGRCAIAQPSEGDHYRKRYVLANLAAFIAVVRHICFAAALEVRQLNAGHLPILHHYAIYAAFGALGAFLPVITGIRSVIWTSQPQEPGNMLSPEPHAFRSG